MDSAVHGATIGPN